MAWCIYKHTNKINGKVYIGQTCNDTDPNKRWQNGKGYSPLYPFGKAIDKYGWHNFVHEVIEENIPTVEEANEREIYWISYYHSYVKDPNCNGYNATLGGDNREHLGNPVYQLDAETFFIIRKWNTIFSASSALNIDHRSIQRVCIGEYLHAGGYCWCFVKDYSENWQIRIDNDKQAVICLETKQVYESVNEASRETGICNSSISRCCRYQQSKAGGFSWQYKFHDDPNHIVTSRLTNACRTIWCFEDKIRFESAAEAARYYNLDPSGIIKCCRGKLKSSGGKHFYYDGEDPSFSYTTYGAKPCECIETGEIYPSTSEAGRKNNIPQTSIAKVCNGTQKTAGNLHWRYLTPEETEFYFKNYIIDWAAASQKNKKVKCLETGKTYLSSVIAGEELNISVQQIRKACTNGTTAGEYHWEYVTEGGEE